MIVGIDAILNTLVKDLPPAEMQRLIETFIAEVSSS